MDLSETRGWNGKILLFGVKRQRRNRRERAADEFGVDRSSKLNRIILIIIIIFINCNWVVTRWQWLFYMYTKHEIGYY